ncbi:hypothetical protein [Thalassotalea maritima]|uniref:hypothetical protein n=1 Tax=Thalassotalea maritima TaxID=3242416 RepID=UPI0035279798
MSKAVKNNRRSLLLLIGVFILPVILAKLALEYQWFNYGVTNQGALLNQPQTLNEKGIKVDLNKQWLLITALPDNCDERCAFTLSGMDNTYLALGRETHRVTPIVISATQLSDQYQQIIHQQSWQHVTQQEHSLSANKVYVVDPLGNIVLTYDKPTTEQAIPAFGKAMLSDLKKVLKLSRIG